MGDFGTGQHSPHPSWWFLQKKVSATPETCTGVGEIISMNRMEKNDTRFQSLHIPLIRIYSLALEWELHWFLFSPSTARSGMIPHIWWERQWGGLKYMDCTMSIRGKFRKTNPKCLRAISSQAKKLQTPQNNKTSTQPGSPTRRVTLHCDQKCIYVFKTKKLQTGPFQK